MQYLKYATVFLLFTICLLGIQLSCNNKKSTSNFPALQIPPADPGGNTGISAKVAGLEMEEIKPSAFTVTTYDNTAKISMDAMKGLQSFDEKSNTYQFSANAKGVATLQPGAVTFFEGHSIKRIVSVTSTGNGFDVVTRDALFTEYFKEADIQWNAHVNWGKSNEPVSAFTITMGNTVFAQEQDPLEDVLKEAEESGNEQKKEEEKEEDDDEGIDLKEGMGLAIPSIDLKEKKLSFSGKLKGWDIKITLQPQGEQLGIELTGSKGKFINLKAKALVSHFNNETSIRVKEGKLEQLEMLNKGLSANMQLMFDAEALGEEENVFFLPVGISKTVLVYGIPVTINVKCIFNIAPVLGNKAKTSASCFLTYNSNTGFKFTNGTTAFNNSSMPQCEIQDGEKKPGGESLATDQIGVGLGLEFPRIEIGILRKLVVPYAVNKTTLKTFFDPGYIMGNKKDKCFQAAAEMKGSVGVMLDFFGLASYKENKDVYLKSKQLVKKGKCDGDL